MNTSYFNSTEMLSKSFSDNMKPDFGQGLIYNLNYDHLTAIALRLANIFPWQNMSAPSQYFVPPFSNLNNLSLWQNFPKTDEKYSDFEINETKHFSKLKDDEISKLQSVDPTNEAINLKILSLPVAANPNSSYQSPAYSDQEEKMSKSSKPEKLLQSGRKRRKSGFQTGVTVGYTYEAFFISDGRSKKRKFSNSISGLSKYTFKKGKKDPESIPALTVIEESAESTTKIQRFVCCECGKNYATSSNLSRHKQTHRTLDSQQARKCPHCDKIYVSMPALSMHILTHDLRHQCDICGKAFSRPWLLQGHRRAHTGEKPYGCAHCGRAFADRSNLRAHMQTHSSMKTYECNACKRNFALKSYLNKHLESSCCLNS